MSENLRTFTKAVYSMDHVVRGVADDQWDQQSPCTDWNAGDVLLHAAGALRMVEAAATGAQPEAAAGGPRTVWAAARDSVLTALDQPGALQVVGPTPFGEMSVDQFIGFIFVDTLTHSWDLARAVGGDDRLPVELVERAHAQLKPIGPMLRGTGRFDDEVAPDLNDDSQTAFIKFVGRQP